MKKRTKQEFITYSQEVHGTNYYYPEVNYVESWTKVTIICPKHGPWKQEPANHLAGHGCPTCKFDTLASSKRSTKNEFIRKSMLIHGDRYDYSSVYYQNTKTHVDIGCLVHGYFQQTPCNHLRGSGCPKCGRRTSKGETIVSYILTKNNISFTTQQTFKGLKGRRKHLPCDFYLPTHNIIIEYDGIQHTRQSNFTSDIEQNNINYQSLLETDEAKNKYAHENGYTLIRIPYTFKKYEDILNHINPYFHMALV